MEYVNLAKLVNYECENKGCIYNNHKGICIRDDDKFELEILDRIRDSIEDNVIPNTTEFACTKADTEYGVCMKCGSALQRHNEPYEYMGVIAYNTKLVCPNCD